MLQCRNTDNVLDNLKEKVQIMNEQVRGPGKEIDAPLKKQMKIL